MIEYIDGVNLDDVRVVMFDADCITNLKYAIHMQSLTCKRLALELRRYIKDRDANGDTFVQTIIEKHDAVAKAQADLSTLKLLLLKQSVWVPND